MEGRASEVREFRLENGLAALLIETHHAPVVCVSVWYRVGSRHDPPGRSGMAHLLEHMMFRGTARYRDGEYDRILHAQGAVHNASTWYDRTNYYVLTGSDRYPLALELEADRMRGASLNPSDLQAELSVVANELERAEDEPASALADRLHATVFRQHPYGRPVIGLREELARITAPELRAFYDHAYHPRNAFLVVAGDFEPRALQAELARTFGVLPPGTRRPPDGAIEPPQEGERRCELRKAGHYELLALAYRIPGRRHAGSYALDILAQVLGQGRTARLYRALVEAGLAVEVSAESQSLAVDPFLFVVEIEPARGVAPARIAAAVEEEIARLCREPISAIELQRAHKRARADFTYRRDSVSARAFLIGEFEIVTGWDFVETYLERLQAVTADEVMAAARRYLVPAARTVGHFLPPEDPREAETP